MSDLPTPLPLSAARRRGIQQHVDYHTSATQVEVRAMLADLLAENQALTARARGAEARATTLEAEVAGLRWIPVGEELPEIRRESGHSYAVQVYRGDHVCIWPAYYTKAGFHELGTPRSMPGVTHWRHFATNVRTPSHPAAAGPADTLGRLTAYLRGRFATLQAGLADQHPENVSALTPAVLEVDWCAAHMGIVLPWKPVRRPAAAVAGPPVGGEGRGPIDPLDVWDDYCERCGTPERDNFEGECSLCGEGVFKAMPGREAQALEAKFDEWVRAQNAATDAREKARAAPQVPTEAEEGVSETFIEEARQWEEGGAYGGWHQKGRLDGG